VFAYICPPRSFINKVARSLVEEFVEITHQCTHVVPTHVPVIKYGIIYTQKI